jgi:hypothetical protein
MPQIKDGSAEAASADSREIDVNGDGRRLQMVRRLNALLEVRGRLTKELADVDRQLALLRREAASDGLSRDDGTAAAGTEVSFPIRAEEAVRRSFRPPQGVDADDLDQCLSKVINALRERDELIGSTELLVRFRSNSGRIVAIESRLAGERTWERRLYRRFDGTSASATDD